MIGVIRKKCPLCGGKIIVSDLYQVSYDYFIRQDGTISKTHKTSSPMTMDASIAACEHTPDNCKAEWDCDSFFIDARGRFVDCKYRADNEEGER